MSTALADIKVLDLTRLLPGGVCTMMLGDMGAEILKVEEPGTGDYIRWIPPMHGETSYHHLVLNRNKRSVTLDLKHDAAKIILRTLVKEADVLVEGFRPGVMDRLGLNYENLKRTNDRLIYCAITGYGQDGPYSAYPGHDINYLGYAGALELSGTADGSPAHPGLNIADIGGGAEMAVIGILAALWAREKTGEGQFVDVSMTDGAAFWLSLHASEYFASGTSPKRGTTALLGKFPCYALYEASDGRYVTLGCLEPQFWAGFCAVIDRQAYAAEQWSEEKRLDIFADIRALMKSRTRDEWIALLSEHNVPAGPVNSIEEAVEDPQLTHRDMFQTIDHPSGGTVSQLGFPIKFSETPARIDRHPPALGEHTDEVLTGLGYAPAAIQRLRDQGVV
jgi:crotonobetainyl-CoA:carnitine CoA-transferase CaiB-like acyl-CoA transferase